MEIKTNLWDITKSIALISALIFLFFNFNKLVNNNVSNIPPEMITYIADNKKILQNLEASDKELKNLIKELEKDSKEAANFLEYVRKENRERDAKIDEIGVTVGKLERTVNRDNVESVDYSSQTTGDVDEDARRNKLTYSKVDINTKSSDGKEVPIAWAMYFPNKEKQSERWRVGTYPLEFHETIIESENDDGTFSRAAELHIENNNHKASNGLEFPIELTTLKWEKAKEREKSFFLWNPRLGLGMSATDTVVAPKLNISLASYGRTKVDMDWRFFTLGVGAVKDYTDAEGVESDLEVMGSFEPFAWNVGKAIPLVENMFAGPEMVAHSDGHMSYGVGLSIPF